MTAASVSPTVRLRLRAIAVVEAAAQVVQVLRQPTPRLRTRVVRVVLAQRGVN